MGTVASNGHLIDTTTGKSWNVTDIAVDWPSEDEPGFTLTCPPELALVERHPAGGYRLIVGVDRDVFQVEPTDCGLNGAQGEMRGRVLY
jgi:hypothetical protein